LCGQSQITDDRRSSNILYNIIISLYCHFVHNLASTNYFQMFTLYESITICIVYTAYSIYHVIEYPYWSRSLRRGGSRTYFILYDDDSSRPTRCAGQEIIIVLCLYGIRFGIRYIFCHLYGLSDFTYLCRKCSWRQFGASFLSSRAALF